MKIVSSKPTITRKDLEGVLDCLINDELTTGNPVRAFESGLSELTGIKFSLATSSLTAAYHLAYRALEISGDDEVIMPTFFTQAPLSALSLTGGRAVLVDNEEGSLFPSAEAIKSKITEKTRAIIVGHTFGYHCDLSGLRDLSIPIIEDISHAAGSETEDGPVGGRGTITVMSLAPSMIITTGNGGMAMTNNTKHYAAMRDLRGGERQLNLDCTLTDFQGAMGISQLMKLKDLLKRRRDIARTYSDAIKLTEHSAPVAYSETFAYQTFPVLFKAPNDKVEKYWKKSGVELAHPLEKPLHEFLNIRGIEYPQGDRLCKKLYALPLYPTLTKKNIEKIIKTLSSFI
jgi:dTDP-4-amino-4,6-dideoxygalactose transaminase